MHPPGVPSGGADRGGPPALPLSRRNIRPDQRPPDRRAAAPAAAARDPGGAWRSGLCDWSGGGKPMKRSRFSRVQSMTIVNGVLCMMVIMVILQLWLFTATVNAYLGG